MDSPEEAAGIDRSRGFPPGLRRPTRVLAFVCGMALILTSILITVEVLSRRFLGRSMTGAGEISGYVLAVTAAWGFGYAVLTQAHIRIDTAIRLVGQPARAFLDLIAYLALLGFAMALAYHAFGVLYFSVKHASRSQTPLQVPLWIPQALWFAGLAFFALVCAVTVAIAWVRLFRRDWAGASAALDADEVAQEIASASENIGRKDAP